ncbi:xanthine dehydrogenase oxidase-like, partial [Paramuricea clavata]
VLPKAGQPCNYNVYAATCTEVEIDVLTGETEILRTDILFDCGKSMNPEIDIGQVEGAFVMGLGYWLTEQAIYDPSSGLELTSGTWDYHPPFSKDIPIDFRVNLLKDAPNPLGILGSK